MKLYNITTDLNDTEKQLVPKVPFTASKYENKAIKRICLAPSVELCLQAMSFTTRPRYRGDLFLLRVVNVNRKDIITPRRLYDGGYVMDALDNKEYWSVYPIRCKVYLCRMEHLEVEFGTNWGCVDINEYKRIVRKYLPNLNTNRIVHPKTLKRVVDNYCEKNEYFDEWDSIDDELHSNRIVQKTSFSNVVYKILKEL